MTDKNLYEFDVKGDFNLSGYVEAKTPTEAARIVFNNTAKFVTTEFRDKIVISPSPTTVIVYKKEIVNDGK